MNIINDEVIKILSEKVKRKDTDCIESDTEYYFAAGQAVQYLLTKSKINNKIKAHYINEVISSENNLKLRENINIVYKKFNNNIYISSRQFNNLFAMYLSYVPDTFI